MPDFCTKKSARRTEIVKAFLFTTFAYAFAAKKIVVVLAAVYNQLPFFFDAGAGLFPNLLAGV